MARSRSLILPTSLSMLFSGAAIAAVTFFAATHGAAAAAPLCAQHSDIVKALAEKHAERPVSVGLTADGSLIEVLSSPDGATWTVLVATPDGNACLLAVGEDWQSVAGKQAAGDPI